MGIPSISWESNSEIFQMVKPSACSEVSRHVPRFSGMHRGVFCNLLDSLEIGAFSGLSHFNLYDFFDVLCSSLSQKNLPLRSGPIC